jgi:hypothetical protein
MTKSTLGSPPQRATDGSGRFAPGNSLALKTGTYSLATVRERSVAIREQLQAHLDSHLQHLTEADQPMVDLAVNVLTKLALIEEYLQRTSGGSLLDGRGVERNATRPYFQLVNTAMRVFRELGIGPRARSEILASLGFAADRKQTVIADAQARLRARNVTPADGADGDAD